MNQTNTVMLGIFIALGVVLVGGLIAIPSMEQASADNGKHTGQNKNGNNGNHYGRGGDI
jgi:hypothetical protein